MRTLIVAGLCLLGAQANALNVGEIIRCRWDKTNFTPSTYIEYNTATHEMKTIAGWYEVKPSGKVVQKGEPCPRIVDRRGRLIQWVGSNTRENLYKRPETIHRCNRRYSGVELMTGDFQPYGRKGLYLIGFGGDVMMIAMKKTNNARNVTEHDMIYPFEAYWGDDRLPGNPDFGSGLWSWGKSRGICWTTSNPGRRHYR